MKDCIFCKIIKNELPCSKVYEDKDILAFMDIQPVNSGHILVIPKKHIELIIYLDDEIIAKMNIVAKKLNIALRKSELKVEGVNYFIADGEAAGQEVFHVHLHIFPRYKKDGFGLKLSDNYYNLPLRKELDEVAEKIKSFL